jgi:hypothetical protein
MRQHFNRNETVDGPLGIRISVWLFVFGILLVCLLMIGRHYTEPGQIAVEEVRDQAPSPHSWPKARRTLPTEISFGSSEDQAGYDNEEINPFVVDAHDPHTWIDGALF